jgi:hypothetical protein
MVLEYFWNLKKFKYLFNSSPKNVKYFHFCENYLFKTNGFEIMLFYGIGIHQGQNSTIPNIDLNISNEKTLWDVVTVKADIGESRPRPLEERKHR